MVRDEGCRRRPEVIGACWTTPMVRLVMDRMRELARRAPALSWAVHPQEGSDSQSTHPEHRVLPKSRRCTTRGSRMSPGTAGPLSESTFSCISRWRTPRTTPLTQCRSSTKMSRHRRAADQTRIGRPREAPRRSLRARGCRPRQVRRVRVVSVVGARRRGLREQGARLDPEASPSAASSPAEALAIHGAEPIASHVVRASLNFEPSDREAGASNK